MAPSLPIVWSILRLCLAAAPVLSAALGHEPRDPAPIKLSPGFETYTTSLDDATSYLNLSNIVTGTNLERTRSARTLQKRPGNQLLCLDPTPRGPASWDDCVDICQELEDQAPDTLVIQPLKIEWVRTNNCKWAIMNADPCVPHAIDFDRMGRWCFTAYYQCVMQGYDALWDLRDMHFYAGLTGRWGPPPYSPEQTAGPSPCETHLPVAKETGTRMNSSQHES